MKNVFNDHPHAIGETYLQHLSFAAGFGFIMLRGGLAAIFHGFFPFLFQKTASDLLYELTRQMIMRKTQLDERDVRLSKAIHAKTQT